MSIEKHLRSLAVGSEEYARAEARLAEKFGRAPLPGDVLWAIAHQRLNKSFKEHDWQSAKMIYFEMALFQFEEGSDHWTTLTESIRCEVHALSETGVAVGVKVLARGCCPACEPLEGRIFTFEEALQLNPIPVRSCSHRLRKSGPAGWCTCEYVAVLPGE